MRFRLETTGQAGQRCPEITDGAVPGAVLEVGRLKSTSAAKRIFADFGEHALPTKLGSITCPTLVVHGERDPVPVASSSAIADAIPQGELAVVSGANHYGFLDRPESVAAVVEPFLVAHAS